MVYVKLVDMKNMRQFFIQDPASGKIRLTGAAIAHSGKDFARAGYDVRKITTAAAFEAAADASFALEMQALSTTARGTDPELDAILAGFPGWE